MKAPNYTHEFRWVGRIYLNKRKMRGRERPSKAPNNIWGTLWAFTSSLDQPSRGLRAYKKANLKSMSVSRVETSVAAVTCPLTLHFDRRIGSVIMVEIRGNAKNTSSSESWRNALDRRKTANATAAPPKQLKFSSEKVDFRTKNEAEDKPKVMTKAMTFPTK